MEPINFMESEERRHTLLVAGSEEQPFPVEKLNSKAVSTALNFVGPCFAPPGITIFFFSFFFFYPPADGEK